MLRVYIINNNFINKLKISPDPRSVDQGRLGSTAGPSPHAHMSAWGPPICNRTPRQRKAVVEECTAHTAGPDPAAPDDV